MASLLVPKHVSVCFGLLCFLSFVLKISEGCNHFLGIDAKDC